nr:putative integron gene cassette protein [uncultured bacterium]
MLDRWPMETRMDHLEMVDAANEAKTQRERDAAVHRLQGWRDAAEHFGRGWSGVSADMHSMAKYGEDTPMCCGVLIDWKPAA